MVAAIKKSTHKADIRESLPVDSTVLDNNGRTGKVTKHLRGAYIEISWGGKPPTRHHRDSILSLNVRKISEPPQEPKASPAGDFRTGDQAFTIGRQVLIKNHPKSDWVGKTGTIVQIEHGKGKPEAQVALITGSKTWAAFQWLEAIAQPEPEEAVTPCEYGDYVRGQSLKDNTWIEGEVTAIGHKYVELDGEISKVILIETLEILRPAIPEPPEEPESETDQPAAAPLKEGDRVKILKVQPHQSNAWVGRLGKVDSLTRRRLHVRLEAGNNYGQGYEAFTLPLPHNFVELADQAIAPTHPSSPIPHPSSPIPHPSDPLSDLATQVSQLYNDYEAAEDVAKQAGQSALQHAYQCGQILLKAKEAVGHGGWEKWREQNIISQRTGKPMPSSTATLFQRVYKHWEDLSKSATVADLTLREAIALLPKKPKPPMPPREKPDAYDYIPLPEVKPVWFKVGDSWTEGQAIATNQRGMTRIVWGESRESDIPSEVVRWSKPVDALTVEDVLLYELEQETTGRPTQPPSITPAATVSYTPIIAPPVACQLCQHRTLIDGVEQDRYWCDMGEFDDTLPLPYDWARDGNEGTCKSFNASPHPLYEQALEFERQAQMEPETPTVRLKVKRTRGKGVEILGAIVQIGGITHYLQLENLTLEDF